MSDAVKRIVIVEDEPAHAEAMCRAIGAALPDVVVEIASTLEEYRELVRDKPPLLALVDMNLPDGKALEVLTKPAEEGPFPVVVLTSFGDQTTAVDCIQAGAIDYVAKSETALQATPRIVERALQQWNLLQERKRAQELLEASEERHRALFENAHDAIFLVKDGSFCDCNPTTCRLFGEPREDILGHSPWYYSPELQPDGTRSRKKAEEMMRAALSGDPQVFEWLHQRRDGTRFDADVSLCRLQLRDQILLQAVVRDVSEKRQFAEKMAEKNRQLEQALSIRDRFLAMMSHELRTPLNAIIGLTGLLSMKLGGPLTPAQEKHLEGVRSSALHLLAIINDLLDLSRLESGRTDPHFEPVAPLEIIREVTSALRPMAFEKRLEFTLDSDEDLPAIRTDRRLLKQILLNLVCNAVKYTDAGGVAVTLSSDEEGVSFRIVDTGPGISEEHHERMFTEFGRFGSDPSKEGTGLGLYLSQKLAGLLGGRITFENAPGGGSVFTLVIERREVGAEESVNADHLVV